MQHICQYGGDHRERRQRDNGRNQRGKGFTHRWRYIFTQRNIQLFDAGDAINNSVDSKPIITPAKMPVEPILAKASG
jgi:hypothetical protein